MIRRFSRRRFVAFAGLALVLGTFMAVAGVISVRRQFAVEKWTDHLAENERQAFLGAVMPSPDDPSLDPNLSIAGLRVEPGQRMQLKGSPFIVFPARLEPRFARIAGLQALDVVADAWAARGLPVEREERRVVVKMAAGDGYMATCDGQDAASAMLWRAVRENRQGPELAGGAAGPAKDASLLPEIPTQLRLMEHGWPGRPGYSVLLQSPIAASLTFKILDGQMKGRGWEPFDERNASALRGATDEKLRSLSVLALTYRHKQAPLGCQLVVSPDSEAVGCSEAMLTLF